MQKLKELFEKHRTLVMYVIVGSFITIFEIFLVRSFHILGLRLVIANTLGIIIANGIQFFLNMKFVFLKPASIQNLGIYIGTLLISLTIANLVIHFAYKYLIQVIQEYLAYYIAKALSAFSSFVSNYIMQKTIYDRV